MSTTPVFQLKFYISLALTVFFLVSVGASYSYAQDTLDEILGTNKPQPSIEGPVQKLGDPNDISEVPDEYIEEAIAFNEECKNTKNLNENYDCNCLASRYLDERIEGEDRINRSSILMNIEKECKSAAKTAGARYQQCIGTAVLMPAKYDVEKYCTCLASTYAKIYEKSKRTPSPRLHLEIHKRASAYCRNPSRGNSLYPGMTPTWNDN